MAVRCHNLLEIMRCLLIDNSNTRTKFAIGTESELKPLAARIPTRELSSTTLTEALQGEDYDCVYLCSVVPEKATLMAEFFQNCPFHKLSYQSDLGIQIDYPKPEQIGADRLANAIGVHQLFRSPAIVIDFGTAVTFDVVGADATYLGGVIAPGLPSMTDYLANRTALLPKIELSEPTSAIGKSTVDAMHVGAVYGYRGLVREIIHKLRDEMPGDPVIVATGGDAELIAQGVEEIQHVSPILTLEGIRIAATRHFQS